MEQWEFGFHYPEPYISIKWILCPSEQRRLSVEELLISGCCWGTLRVITTTIMLRWRLMLSQLSQNLILLGHQLLHCGSWRRWRGNLLVMPATLPSYHLKTEIVAIVIPTHISERQDIISYGRKNAIIIILGSK